MTLPRTKMTSPKGTAVWPWLNEPDTRFDDNGVYTVQLRLDAEEAAAFTAELKEKFKLCLLYTSPSPRDGLLSRMPSSA